MEEEEGQRIQLTQLDRSILVDNRYIQVLTAIKFK